MQCPYPSYTSQGTFECNGPKPQKPTPKMPDDIRKGNGCMSNADGTYVCPVPTTKK